MNEILERKTSEHDRNTDQKKAQTVITHFAVPNTVSIAEFQQQKLSDRVHENSWIAKLKCVHFEINAVGRMGAFRVASQQR